MGAKKIKRKNVGPPDFPLLLVTLALLSIGLVMVFSSSVGYLVGFLGKTNIYYFFQRQLIFAGLGLVGMIALMNIPHHLYRRFATHILVAGIVVLLLVYSPLGVEQRGSSRWVNIGLTLIQPSELIKLALAIFLAFSLAESGVKNLKAMKPSLLALILCTGMVVIQPDLGTTMVLALTGISMFISAGLNFTRIFAILGGVAGAAVIVISQKKYMMDRVMAWYDPWQVRAGDGYQTVNAMLALGSGGLFGVGLGRGMQKFGYVPENYTDMIFAIIGEETGLIGTTTVLLLFVMFIWRGFSIAARVKDPFSRYLAVGITCMIGFQAIMNLGVVTGMLPVTGVTLPFISFGGSSLTLKLASVGVLLNVSRYAESKPSQLPRTTSIAQ
jgi:cell division protein FtsW